MVDITAIIVMELTDLYMYVSPVEMAIYRLQVYRGYIKVRWLGMAGITEIVCLWLLYSWVVKRWLYC
jgi:hypothetical protein